MNYEPKSLTSRVARCRSEPYRSSRRLVLRIYSSTVPIKKYRFPLPAFHLLCGLFLLAPALSSNFGHQNSLLLSYNDSNAFLPAFVNAGHLDTFCVTNSIYSKPVVLFAVTAGLTNYLMSLQQVFFVCQKINLPLEVVGFVLVGCDHSNSWPMCNNNSFIPFHRVFNLGNLRRLTGVFVSEAQHNYCYKFHLDRRNVSSSSFDYKIFEPLKKGRTHFSTHGWKLWSAYITHGEKLSWVNFVGMLFKSISNPIMLQCNRIYDALPDNFVCIHVRDENDGKSNVDILEAEQVRKRNNTTFYYVTRLERSFPDDRNIYTKFAFGNFAANVPSLIVDACICSRPKAIDFAGTGFSTFSLLIATARQAAGLHPGKLYGHYWGKQHWFYEYWGELNVSYIQPYAHK